MLIKACLLSTMSAVARAGRIFQCLSMNAPRDSTRSPDTAVQTLAKPPTHLISPSVSGFGVFGVGFRWLAQPL